MKKIVLTLALAGLGLVGFSQTSKTTDKKDSDVSNQTKVNPSKHSNKKVIKIDKKRVNITANKPVNSIKKSNTEAIKEDNDGQPK